MSRIRQYPGTLLIIGIALVCNYELIFGLEGRLVELLELKSVKVTSGEIWRLVAGNFVHISAGHFWIDLTAISVLGFLYEKEMGWYWAGLILVASLLIGLVFCFYVDRLDLYRGLSGTAHGCFAAALVLEYRLTRKSRIRRSLILLISAGFIWKVVYETISGQFFWAMSQDTALMGLPVPEAHLTGAVTGFLYALLFVAFRAKGRENSTVGNS
ncbi:rhombosortase [Planctomycetota bacterium]